MNRRESKPVAAPIVELQRELEEHRRLQPRRAKLPESIWETAAELAREHGVYAVAQALRLDYYYCVIDVGHNKAGSTEAALPALWRPGCAEWQSNAGYGVVLAPRGFQSGGTSGRASWSCPARDEGEKRLRSAIRKP